MMGVFWLLFFFVLSFCRAHHSILCPEIEKQALLTFKHSLKNFTHPRFSSWNAKVDCCKWSGVVCSNLTGRVHELSLSGYALSGKLHPALLNLKHLAYLDLSDNDFDETIPSFIGSFMSLEYLNLSFAGFYGSVPHTVGNLSNLRTLSLSSSQKLLSIDSFEWLSSLSELEGLNMLYVNLSGANDWARVINTLPSLVKLSLRSCSLGVTAPLDVTNTTTTTRLTIIDLFDNRFHSFVGLSWIFKIQSLRSLDLRWNMFEGSIPSISNATNLQKIDLSVNNFNSSIPDWFYSCKDLEVINFEWNNLRSEISNDIRNLTSLKILYLDFNEISGEIPHSLGNLSSLESLDLSHNRLEGAIPTSLGKLSSLRHLYMENNKLTGNLPESLGQISNLVYLSFGHNVLEGFVTELHFVNLAKLGHVVASSNDLTLRVNPNWVPPFHLQTLELASWNVGTSMPSWIQTQKYITELDLSNTGISGIVPTWAWKIPYLDLSHNQLHGTIPNIIPPQSHVYLSSNKFDGPLPSVTSSVVELDLSNNSFSGDMSLFLCGTTHAMYLMEMLHLGDNKLHGVLPDCWMNWPSLKVLYLGNNFFFGSIPNSIGFLSSLRSLSLSNNSISGRVPFSMLNCTNLEKIDLSYNDLEGNIPTGMGTSLRNLAILILGSNKLSGELSSSICELNSLQVLDLSNNKLSGRMPNCIGNFTPMAKGDSLPKYSNNPFLYTGRSRVFRDSAYISTKGRQILYETILSLVTNIDLSKNKFSGDIPKELTSLVKLRSLDLSENRFTGSIPRTIGDMKQLESLDLSRNSLSGGIPNSMTGLSFLSYLNLSYNNLSGRIPDSTQLRGLDPSSFMGNNLCGPPLTLMKNCNNEKRLAPKESNEGNESEVEWLYIFLSLGYAVGFSTACSVLVLKKSWRVAVFGFVEEVCHKVYVYFSIKWTRLARRWAGAWVREDRIITG